VSIDFLVAYLLLKPLETLRGENMLSPNKHLALVCLCLVTIIAVKSYADAGPLPAIHQQDPQSEYSVKISMVNDLQDTNRQDIKEVFVRPGDSVRLSADLFDQSGRALRTNIEDFVWANGLNDICDLQAARESQTDCSKTSNFQVTNDGVIFHVPQNVGDSLVLTVRSHSQGNDSFDFIMVRNISVEPYSEGMTIMQVVPPTPGAPTPSPGAPKPGTPTPTPGVPGTPTPVPGAPGTPGTPSPTPTDPHPTNPQLMFMP
jgi:hypothetical protein